MESAFNHKRWSARGLKDFGDYAECVEYINQSELGDGTIEGEWYYVDDENKTIYFGTFGNYNSPGASSYTYADQYGPDEWADYGNKVAILEDSPEYLETEDDDEDDESNIFEDEGESPFPCGQCGNMSCNCYAR